MDVTEPGDVDYEVTMDADGTPRHRWRRECKQCGRNFEKTDPTTTVTCACGWEW